MKTAIVLLALVLLSVACSNPPERKTCEELGYATGKLDWQIRRDWSPGFYIDRNVCMVTMTWDLPDVGPDPLVKTCVWHIAKLGPYYHNGELVKPPQWGCEIHVRQLVPSVLTKVMR